LLVVDDDAMGRSVMQIMLAPQGYQLGERAKVTMYYNGPRLVQYETRGSHVTKRRFTITGEDGNTLEVETMPISPPGKAETIRFKRQPAS
jgi:CheY-like chemotaxis protein